MILKKETPIGENETYGELHDRLAVIGAQALVETVDLLEQGIGNRVVIQKDSQITDYDILEALTMHKDLDPKLLEVNDTINI